MASSLATADLLAVGALADVIRSEEAGAVVRVYANVRPEPSARAIEVRRANGEGAGAGAGAGIQFLRAVAIARIPGPQAAEVRLDWAEVGIELAQVALGFGASELVGPIATKRGLAIADDATKKVKGEGMVSLQAMKQREQRMQLTGGEILRDRMQDHDVDRSRTERGDLLRRAHFDFCITGEAGS